MKLDLKHIPNIVLAIRWGLLGLALLVLFVFERADLGLALVVLGLLFAVAMRFSAFRVWLVSRLTGLDHEALKGRV